MSTSSSSSSSAVTSAPVIPQITPAKKPEEGTTLPEELPIELHFANDEKMTILGKHANLCSVIKAKVHGQLDIEEEDSESESDDDDGTVVATFPAIAIATFTRLFPLLKHLTTLKEPPKFSIPIVAGKPWVSDAVFRAWEPDTNHVILEELMLAAQEIGCHPLVEVAGARYALRLHKNEDGTNKTIQELADQQEADYRAYYTGEELAEKLKTIRRTPLTEEEIAALVKKNEGLKAFGIGLNLNTGDKNKQATTTEKTAEKKRKT